MARSHHTRWAPRRSLLAAFCCRGQKCHQEWIDKPTQSEYYTKNELTSQEIAPFKKLNLKSLRQENTHPARLWKSYLASRNILCSYTSLISLLQFSTNSFRRKEKTSVVPYLRLASQEHVSSENKSILHTSFGNTRKLIVITFSGRGDWKKIQPPEMEWRLKAW